MPNPKLITCMMCGVDQLKTRYNAHVATCNGKIQQYMPMNEDPEVLSDAFDIDPSAMNMVQGALDQEMYDNDMIEYDFGNCPHALAQQPYADNCHDNDDDRMTDDDDFATDDNYNDHSDNEDDNDEENASGQEAVTVEGVDQMYVDEEEGLYVDPWNKEPPLCTGIPFEEIVQGTVPLDKYEKKSFELQKAVVFANDCLCGKEQFLSDGKPIASMSYFPIRQQLAYMIADSDICMSILDTVTLQLLKPGEEVLTDITNGTVYRTLKAHLFQNQIETNLSLTVSLLVDGFTPFKGSGNSRMTIVHLVLLSLSPKERCRQCRIKTTSEISPAGKGRDRYYPGTIAMSEPRTDDKFVRGMPKGTHQDSSEIQAAVEHVKSIYPNVIQEFKTKFNVDENAKWSSRNVKALYAKMFKHLEKEAGPTLPLKACIGHWGARLMLQKHWSNVEQGTHENYSTNINDEATHVSDILQEERLYDEAYSGVKNVSNDDNAPSDNYDFESGGSREVTDRSDDEETSSNDDTTSTSTGSSSDENETDIDDDDDDENDGDDEDDNEEEQTTNKKVVDRLDNDNEKPLNHGLANEQQTKVK
ncbi:hypothetical protein BDC45DRAFT_575875 [Circinella umbellata]|nr:hypothetical protein BDC45DRAFT_575875 [Circinella umbellata]